MVLLCPVAWVMGASKPTSVPLVHRLLYQDTEKFHPRGTGARNAPAGHPPAGAGVLLLSGTLDALDRVGDLVAVAVLVVGSYEVRVAEDPVLVDVEAVELLVGLHADADGGLERGEDRERGEKNEPAAGHDTESLDAELVEAASVEEAGLADGREGRGGEEAAGERAPDAAHPVRSDGAERVVHPDPVHVDEGGIHYDAGQQADHYGRPGSDEGARSGDRDQGRDGAVAAHPHVDVALVQVAH